VSIVAGLLGLTVALLSLPFTPTPPSTDKADH
ncbi:MAG: hypothetical protein RLZZ471_1029, partial [Actinomycetota bacterium]